MESLVWFRSDLRIEDNPALRYAFENSKKIHAIFIFSNKQLKKHNEANVKIDFIIKNLFLLEKELTELNVPLTIIQSDGFENDASLIGKFIDKKISIKLSGTINLVKMRLLEMSKLKMI